MAENVVFDCSALGSDPGWEPNTLKLTKVVRPWGHIRWMTYPGYCRWFTANWVTVWKTASTVTVYLWIQYPARWVTVAFFMASTVTLGLSLGLGLAGYCNSWKHMCSFTQLLWRGFWAPNGNQGLVRLLFTASTISRQPFYPGCRFCAQTDVVWPNKIFFFLKCPNKIDLIDWILFMLMQRFKNALTCL